MKIVIQTLDFVLWAELECYITESLTKLEPQAISIVRAEVILGEDNNDSSRAKFCNVRLITTGAAYLVAQHADTWEHAVDATVNDLARKIKKDTSSSLP